jgi:hypothetical protein
MYIYKSKSAITFKEYKHKINKLNKIDNDWGFYVDIETNKVINKKMDLFIKTDTEENYSEENYSEENYSEENDNIFNSCNKYLFFISISLFILIIF